MRNLLKGMDYYWITEQAEFATGESRRQSARISRLLKRLPVHGLIAKIPRSLRWRVTHKGQTMMALVLIVHHEEYPKALANNAA